MQIEKLSLLKHWRDGQARREGVDAYRVLGNQTLEEIIQKNVQTEAELLEVKGIKEKKLAKYGREILQIMTGEEEREKTWIPAARIKSGICGRGQASKADRYELGRNDNTGEGRASQEIIEQGGNTDKIFSVSVFLDLVNIGLQSFSARVQGEVSGMNVRGGHYYFDLKDKVDGSVLSCFIWKNNYAMFGVNLRDGLEIVVHGNPGVHKPNGRLSFRVNALELLGEGALKLQYEQLKAKLEKEGLFSAERKKPIPLFPEKIGLITSRQGEAIFDFRTNLGQFGFKILFMDSRVEGAQAVPGLIKAIRCFRKSDIDVLVLVRGGGSLESLLSFNNEALAREIADFPKPVVSGIGHEQDVSLVDLVADRSCSTPTGAAKLLSYSWEQARSKVDLAEKQLFGFFRNLWLETSARLADLSESIKHDFRGIFVSFQSRAYSLKEKMVGLVHSTSAMKSNLQIAGTALSGLMVRAIAKTRESVDFSEKAIGWNDPARQLKAGYSLLFCQDKLVRSVEDISLGMEIEVELCDGRLVTSVEDIKKPSDNK